MERKCYLLGEEDIWMYLKNIIELLGLSILPWYCKKAYLSYPMCLWKDKYTSVQRVSKNEVACWQSLSVVYIEFTLRTKKEKITTVNFQNNNLIKLDTNYSISLLYLNCSFEPVPVIISNTILVFLIAASVEQRLQTL